MMKSQNLLYLASLIVFLVFVLLIRLHQEKRLIKKYEFIVLIVVGISIPYAATDYFALKWGAWHYSPEHTLNIKIPTEIEAYIFSAVMAFIICLVTLFYAPKISRHARARK